MECYELLRKLLFFSVPHPLRIFANNELIRRDSNIGK